MSHLIDGELTWTENAVDSRQKFGPQRCAEGSCLLVFKSHAQELRQLVWRSRGHDHTYRHRAANRDRIVEARGCAQPFGSPAGRAVGPLCLRDRDSRRPIQIIHIWWAVAGRTRRCQVDHRSRGDGGAHLSTGHRESNVGLPPHSRRARHHGDLGASTHRSSLPRMSSAD